MATMTPTDAEVAAMVTRLNVLITHPQDSTCPHCTIYRDMRAMLTRLAAPAADSGVREALQRSVAALDEWQSELPDWKRATSSYIASVQAQNSAALAGTSGTTTLSAATSQDGEVSTSSPERSGALQDATGGSVADPTTINEAGSVEGHAAASRADSSEDRALAEAGGRRFKADSASNAVSGAPAAGIESGPASPQDDALIARLNELAANTQLAIDGNFEDMDPAAPQEYRDLLHEAAARLRELALEVESLCSIATAAVKHHIDTNLLPGLLALAEERDALKAALAATASDVAAMRERCAKACADERVDAAATRELTDEAYNMACEHCAAAIRALPLKEGT